MSPSLVLCLVTAYLLVGFALGFACARQRWSTVSDEGALNDLQLNLAQQAVGLNGFRQELQAAQDRGTTVGRDRVEQAYESNRLFERQLDSSRERLTRTRGEQSDWKQVLDNLRAHCGRVHDFGELLEQSLQDKRPEELASALARAVTELCHSNRSLESELQDARKTIATQQTRLEEAEREARLDPLTKLVNRRGFDERIAACQTRFERNHEGYAVVLFDLDRFKALNDKHGHRTGDAVLAVFGRILAESVRGYDQAVRLGGEEFAAIVSAAGVREARVVAERCRRRVEQAVVHRSGLQVRVTVSAGIAAIRPGETPEALLERADAALYAAKAAGRNCVRVSEDEEAAGTPDEPATIELAIA